jgi:hypothetical protein
MLDALLNSEILFAPNYLYTTQEAIVSSKIKEIQATF